MADLDRLPEIVTAALAEVGVDFTLTGPRTIQVARKDEAALRRAAALGHMSLGSTQTLACRLHPTGDGCDRLTPREMYDDPMRVCAAGNPVPG